MISRCRLWLLLLITVAITPGIEAAPPSVIYRINGVVVSSVDGSPVPRAHLTATPALSEQNGERQLYRRTARLAGVDADADEHGRFVLTVPSVGRWRLVASAIGFVTQAYNAHDAFSSAVVLSQTHPQVDLQFRIAPEAEISGTVLDEAGEAVRNARVVLEHRPAPSPDREQEEFRNRMFLQTDDRGMYDFSGLAPGDYRVMVDAKPWYSTSTQPRLGNSDTPQDSALDVTYQLTWYPGVDDPAEAEVFSLKPGDIRRADFQLTPVPAVHISFTSPAENGSRRFPSFPVVERIGAGGAGLAAVIPARSSNGGKVDVGGLAPGLYRIRMAGPNQEQETKLIEIRAGDSRIVDGTVAASEMVNVTIANESSGASRAVGAELIDTEKGTRFTSFSPDVFFRARPIAAPATQEEKPMVLQVPPGRYEVRLADHEAYLLGISAKGAEVAGRFVVVHGGDVTLKLHTATGRASVHGIAATNGIPVEGAMVLLVPAGLDDPSSFTRIVRDQTNTDGSFDLNDVIPGQYILIAVTNGWQIPWDHAATLQRYLTQGIPLELGPNAKVEQNINSQKP